MRLRLCRAGSPRRAGPSRRGRGPRSREHHRPGRELRNGKGGRVGRVDWGRVENNGAGRVARNVADRVQENSGQTTKNHLTASNPALVEASPRRRLELWRTSKSAYRQTAVGRVDHRLAGRIAKLKDWALVEDGAPMDSDAYGLHRFLGEVVAEVHIDRSGERDRSGQRKLLKLPDRLKVSTTSALAAGAAIRASAARTVADANLLVPKENNVCPPAKESDGFIDPPS